MKRLGSALLFSVVAICLAPTLVPPFLDRIYYDGPRSGHYDGERFFNPGVGAAVEAHERGRFGFLLQSWMGAGAKWPERVPVTPTVPPRRVAGEAMRVTWIGHATVLVQTRGLNILTDPVWAERVSPFSFIGPRRVRAPGVAFDHLPPIDLILLSHNHYDHLDLTTLARLWERDRPLIVTSLGNDAILDEKGIGARALDWGDKIKVADGVEVVVERNHHWSSRWGADRNRALWSAFTVRLPDGNIFFAGDTGWGDGTWVKEAAARGPIRLAILPIGAYEPRGFMKVNHVNPEEAVRIFQILDPAQALGTHWGTFQLTWEAIDEPVRRVEALRQAKGIAAERLLTIDAGGSFEVPAL